VVLCCREQQCLWRKEDIEQRHLENARVLWARILERNRRDVEEKSEQLKAISTLAALISGFALTAFLQFDFCDYQDKTGAALPIFGISLALTVSSCAGPAGCSPG
jgi:calcium release-activated calcium channel protein 1